MLKKKSPNIFLTFKKILMMRIVIWKFKFKNRINKLWKTNKQNNFNQISLRINNKILQVNKIIKK
jgi:hypothetical protein